MLFLKRLPIYAAGLGFTIGLVLLADSRGWSGPRTVAAAIGVGAFYVVTILVPWLIREQTMSEGRSLTPLTNGHTNGDVIVIHLDESGFAPSVTHGPATLRPVERPKAVLR
jgi:hypothetical protein